MASAVVRWFVGGIFFVVGIFWSFVAILGFSFAAVRNGRRGISGIFKNKPRSHKTVGILEKFEHDYVQTKSGVQFHCVHSGIKSKPLMLCLHGFPECWYSYHYILDHFKENFHVVAFDLRGYGKSDKPKAINEYHLNYLVRDVKELINALGYEKAIVVGHDWGGVVAWSVPEFYPDVVEKLIILNAPHKSAFYKFVFQYPSQLLKSWYIFLYQLPFLGEFFVSAYDYKAIESAFNGKSMGIKSVQNKLSSEEVDIYKLNAEHSLSTAIAYYRALNPIYTGLNMKPKCRTISQQVLLIWGKQDSALDFRMIPFIQKYVHNLQVRFIDKASHWVTLDEPEEVHSAMEEFLGL